MVKILLGIDRSLYQIKFEKICELANALNFDGIELQPEHPDIFKLYPSKAIKFFEDIISNYNFKISFHTPIKDLNIASYNQRMREISILEIQKSIEFANKIGAKYIVTHGGKNSFKTRSLFSKKYERLALNYTIIALKSFYKLSEEFGISLSVENMTYSDWRMSSKINHLKAIFEEIPGLRLTLDIDHALERTKRYVDKFIEIFKNELISAHLGAIHKNISHIKKLLGLLNVKFFTLEPHSFTYLITPNIIEFIEKNVEDLKKVISTS